MLELYLFMSGQYFFAPRTLYLIQLLVVALFIRSYDQVAYIIKRENVKQLEIKL